MTPIGGGAPVGLSLAQPLPLTLLSLHRYAKVMGINPAHFWGASGPNLDPQVMPVSASCSSVWFQYAWQDFDRVSRYDIAFEIANAEQDITKLLGYWPAPTWTEDERVVQIRPYRREYYGIGTDIRGQMKKTESAFGRVIETGRRAVSLIGTATVAGGSLVYSDEDADGFYETATVTFPTTLTDAREIKLYHSNAGGDPQWEIRDPRSKVITGGNVVMVFDAWLFINPDLYEFLPDSLGNTLIDLGVVMNFVTTVDIYREYSDPTQAAVVFYWEPEAIDCGLTDEACDPVSQDGCLRIYDHKNGILTPVPASYDSVDGNWDMATSWTGSREPDYMTIYYKSGDVSQEYERGFTTDPMSNFWAQTIAWLATSRLQRPVCACGNYAALAEWLMMDTKENRPEVSFFTPDEISRNPFGTRNGEIAAYRRIQKLVRKRPAVALA